VEVAVAVVVVVVVVVADRGWMGRAPMPVFEFCIKNFSSCERTKMPLPVAPARAVRPRRWIYC